MAIVPGTSQVEALDCASCGAPLEAAAGRATVTCSYCGRSMRVSGPVAELAEPAGPQRAADQLLIGYQRDVGEGRRYDIAGMHGRDWRAPEHGVWPIAARASTTFGGGWAPHAVLGRPSIYPGYGDRAGAWAPRARTSHIEWLEVSYPVEVGPVSALRVFETHVAGAAFAVTVIDDDGEEIVWQRRPEAHPGGAQVLEVSLDPPRPVRRARVYITNSGQRWAQIDTVGLVAVDPVPAAVRKRFRRRRSYGAWIALAVVLLLVGGFLWLGRTAASVAHEESNPRLSTPPTALEGATARAWPTDVAGLAAAGVVWADGAPVVSSQYGKHQWAAVQAAGAPDTYPAHGDRPTAWASRGKNDGAEWIELSWATPVDTRRIAVVETFNPGALARIDDISGADEVTLWQGRVEPSTTSRVLVIELPRARRLSGLRVVLDTTRAAGWNEIDAVGLVPEERP